MTERAGELQKKEVINLMNGQRLGFVYDVLLDLENARLLSLIVPGRNRFFVFFGKYEEYVIPFEKIVKIGDDIILVEYEEKLKSTR